LRLVSGQVQCIRVGQPAVPREDALKTRKSGQRAPEGLSDQQIVVAALDLIQREGADQLSMRQLAKELGVTPMAIYYYFGNKDALFERLADAVLARLPRPVPSGRKWQEELLASSVEGFRLLSQYPGLSAYIIKRPPGQQSEALAQYGTSILVAAGFERNASALAITALQAFMFGMIAVQAQLELRAQEANPLEGLDPKNVKHLLEFGVDALLRGLESKLPRKRRTAAAPARSPRR
jgi:AcrR family transcriptional regulator